MVEHSARIRSSIRAGVVVLNIIQSVQGKKINSDYWLKFSISI